jgi:glutamate-1-semialdehyde 2,1-aminomutase
MAGSSQAVIDRRKLDALRAREDARFAERTPRSAALARRAGKHLPGGVPMAWMKGLFRTPPIYVTHGEGARFFDVDGNGYLDFNVADLAMTMGFGPKPIADAVARQIAEGAHFLLPGEAAVEVAEELARRVGLPAWQFTLSASAANVEVIRIARFVTGRQKIVVFEGHYHGHIEETLVHRDESGGSRPDLLGLAPGAARHTVVVPFNDLEALEAVLEGGEVALVVTEPALTNCNLVLPDAGFLAGLRALTQAHGALLCYDEAHTFQFAYGGLVKAWALESDFVVLGKGLGSGVSFALYGMTAPVAEVFERHIDVDIGPAGIATGGTTYGSALAVAAAKAALTEVLTPEGYDHVTRLGAALAEGLRGIFAKHDLPWTAFELGPRSGYCLAPALPRSYAEAALSLDAALIDARRVFMANRGIWDAVASAGPQASFAHTDRDIAAYLETADAFITAVV